MGDVHLFVKAFFGRIINDFRHKELLPLKLLFFVHSSTVYVLYPYLTIHMRELGINVEETAIMSAVTPVVAIVMPPLAGMVADRIGNFKILLATFSALGGAAALLLLVVPVGRMSVTYPDHLIMDLSCQEQGRLHLGLNHDQPCDIVPDLMLEGLGKEVGTQFEACGFLCSPDRGPNFSPPEDLERLLVAHSYLVTVTNGNVTDTFSYTLTPEDMPVVLDEEDDARNHRFYKNNDHYRTSIRSLSEGQLFFPTTGLYNLSCTEDSDGYGCAFGELGVSVAEGVSTIPALKKMFRTKLMAQGDGDYWAAALSNWTQPDAKTASVNASCTDVYRQVGHDVDVTVPLHNPDNALLVDKTLLLSSCSPRCLVTVPRAQVCSDLKSVVEYDISLTFWLYLCIRVFISMIGGTAFAMFEGAVIAILREHKADYGLQRIYATIGGMISSPLSGLLIDYASRGKGYTDFSPAFYLYAGLKIASGLLILTINLEFKAPAKNIVTDVMTVLKNVELLALLVVIFVLGTAWGYIESFLFWLLQDLGGSRSLMGITITVGGIAGIPLLVLSGPIIDRIGHANVLFIGFIFYSIRLLGYSLIYNPWLCLIFEAMESVTSSLSFTAAVTYAAKLSTSATDSSIQGLLGGLYFGVGKGAGSLVGGYLMKWIGTRPTYQVFSVMCAVVGIGYFLFNKLYLRKRPQVEGNDIVKKKRTFLDAGNMVEIDLTGSKEKKSKQKQLATANNNAVETLPINTTASRGYASAANNKLPIDDPVLVLENNTRNLEVSKYIHPVVEACNINLGYDDDDYESIGESIDDKEQSSAEEVEKRSDEPTKGCKGYDNPILKLEEDNAGAATPNQCDSKLPCNNETKDKDTECDKEKKDDKKQN